MTLISEHDFETRDGQKRIVLAIHNLEVKIRDLSDLVRECIKKEQKIKDDLIENN